jgi:hypothetical protein
MQEMLGMMMQIDSNELFWNAFCILNSVLDSLLGVYFV